MVLISNYTFRVIFSLLLLVGTLSSIEAQKVEKLMGKEVKALWENAGEPVVITHTKNGDIKAFYNTCSHRGAPVVTAPHGKKKRLTCAYHGWSYDHDGEGLIEDSKDTPFSNNPLDTLNKKGGI